MKGKKYNIETNSYVEVDIIGKVMYKGKSFGVEGLTDGKIYECMGIEEGMLRIIDDSEEDYLYSACRPSSLDNPELFGEWIIIEDNENKDIEKAIS